MQGDAEAEPDQTQGCQPLHGYTHRAAQVREPVEVVVDGGNAVWTVEGELAAGLEHVAHVEEGAHAGGLGELGGHREDQLVLAGDAEVAAVGVAELVLRSEEAFAEGAYVVRSAAEEVAVRRD